MAILAGGLADAADLTPGVGIGISAYIKKGTSESVTSSITAQDDDALFFTMAANAEYEVEFFLSVSGNTGGDFKSQWSVPADALGLKQVMGPAIATSATWVARDDTNGRFTSHGYGTAVSYHIEANGSFIWERALISSVTGGTLRLQWAQFVSNATATVISGNSYMKYTRMS